MVKKKGGMSKEGIFVTVIVAIAFVLVATNYSESFDNSLRGITGNQIFEGSCAGFCGDTPNNGACYCDDACISYGDCCGDYEVQCLNVGGGAGQSVNIMGYLYDQTSTDSREYAVGTERNYHSFIPLSYSEIYGSGNFTIFKVEVSGNVNSLKEKYFLSNEEVIKFAGIDTAKIVDGITGEPFCYVGQTKECRINGYGNKIFDAGRISKYGLSYSGYVDKGWGEVAIPGKVEVISTNPRREIHTYVGIELKDNYDYYTLISPPITSINYKTNNFYIGTHSGNGLENVRLLNVNRFYVSSGVSKIDIKDSLTGQIVCQGIPEGGNCEIDGVTIKVASIGHVDRTLPTFGSATITLV